MVIIEILHAIIQAVSHYIFSTTEKNIRNEIVLITGSGRGLGQQIAILFAKRGAIVVLCDTNEIGNSQTIELISAINNEQRIYSYTCDIGNRDEVDQLVKKIHNEVGDITILVNNAAVITSNSILDMTEEEFLDCLNANLFSVYWLIRRILPSMMTRNHGHIITMLGSTAIFGLGNFSAICTAKSGLVGLMESVDHELTLGGYDGIYTTSAVSHYLTTHLLQLSKTCFNPVVPPLTLDYAAKKIMHAILINRKFVCVPRLYYLIPFIKGILPSRAFLILLNTFVNPKIPTYTRHEPSQRSNSSSPTHHIPRKRSHMSACQ
jgi:NAD(P)-dependent dehydrogenase (short-subunit alcohol dehydrogenase family)